MSKKSKSYKKFKFWEGAEEEQPEKVSESFFQETEGLPDSKLTVKETNYGYEKKAIHPVETGCSDYKELIQNIRASKGSQWKILEYFAERSLETGSLSTGHFKISKLAKQTGLEEKTIYTAIYRLERQKQLIIRQKGKEGSGGSSRFMFASEDIKNQILCSRDKVISNRLNVSNVDAVANLDIGWNEINTDLLSEIGLNQKHVFQLRNYSTPQIVQESIRHFAFGLQNNAKTQSYKDPVAVLIGVLRKGEAWIESAYKSPQEIAMEKLLVQKKDENTRLQQLEEKLQNEYFVEWSKNLTEEQMKIIVGDKITGPKSLQEKAKTGLLKEYFQVNEWLRLKKSILSNQEN
jgi:hypothetical protein